MSDKPSNAGGTSPPVTEDKPEDVVREALTRWTWPATRTDTDMVVTALNQLARERDDLAEYMQVLTERMLLAEQERDRLAEALRDTEATLTDWTKGVDDNMEAMRDIARRALAPSPNEKQGDDDDGV